MQPDRPGPPGAAGLPRRDIQGLRAVAVFLVVVFHLSPALLPGGYVGVDVFFVVSGFLITSHLLREVERTGTVSLPAFWARRARRLLPASLTVLLAAVGGIWLVTPAGETGRFLGEVIASTLYVENVALAASSVDYLAAEAAPSPVQHFWSLSVEEQFYLVWPVIVLATVVVAARWARRAVSVRRALGIVLCAVVVGSLLWSVISTQRDPEPAYFLATTRAWEFGAGGMLAIVEPTLTARFSPNWRRVRVTCAWLGLALIGFAAVLFGPSTPFPGSAALLPVLGTVAVLAANEPEGRVGPAWLLSPRPIQRIGDLSYGVYLWHWPLIVLVPLWLERALSVTDAILVVVATIVLAAGTERWVENPLRNGRLRVRRPRVTLVATAFAMVAVALLPLGTLGPAQERLVAEQERVQRLVDTNPGCLGAAVLASGSCSTAELAAAVIPDPSLANASPERCITPIRSSELTVCAYGADKGRGLRTVALIGDSHAEQWLPALAELAAQREWTLFVLAKSSCPFGPDRRFEKDLSAEVLAEMNESCAEWNDAVLRWLSAHPEVDTVLTAARARNPVVAERGDADWRMTAIRHYRERWAELPDTVGSVIVLRDTPRMRDDYLVCLAQSGTAAPDTCATDAADALSRDPAAEAALGAFDPRVGLIDMTGYFCQEAVCPPVIGGVLAFRDSHHLSWVYAQTLAPFLGAEIDAVAPRGP